MPRYSRPRRTPASYIRLGLIPTLALACIVALFFAEHRFRRDQQHWPSTTATIEQTRVQPIPGRPFEYGSHQLYEVDVLLTYNVANQPHHDWLPLSQPPQNLSAAQAQRTALPGKPCNLRWDPAHPDNVLAELR
jgi:hypothetical protein